MKLKKSSEPETIAPLPATGDGAVIADRFKLDLGDAAPKAKSSMGATIALVAALAGVGLIGATAWLIYQNLTLLEGV